MPATTTWPGSSGESILFVHATGLCKETWTPVVASLRSAGIADSMIAIDQPGHGEGEAVTPPLDWWDLARPVLDLAAESGARTAVGHSSGGAALAMAEILRPGTFDRLVLIEPIAYPPGYGDDAGELLAELARQRRSTFTTVEDARRHFAGRGVFADWVPAALDAYVKGGLRKEDDELVLACSPEVEAAYYEAGPRHGAWARLDEVLAPVLILAGEHSNSHPVEFAQRQAAQFGEGKAEVIIGAGHMVPMERPKEVAEAIAGWLGKAAR